jgi:peptidoglycan/xylan/chitin deacetylase (PgdA/CDA1 family)
VSEVPILMYHSIGGADRLAVRPEAFAEQMAYLRDHGYTPVPLGARTRPADRPVVITFDDGYADFHEHALPVLDRLGFPATVFVTTGWLDDAGPYAAGRPLGRMLTWRQTEEIAACGVEIGAHGHSHAQLDQLGRPALRDELRRSRSLLQDRLGRTVAVMAYPYGYSSARVRHEVRAAGYDKACAVANSVMTTGHDPLALPRLTVRAATSIEGFGRALDGRGFRTDHALTKGYAVIRRSRYAARRLRGAA